MLDHWYVKTRTTEYLKDFCEVDARTTEGNQTCIDLLVAYQALNNEPCIDVPVV